MNSKISKNIQHFHQTHGIKWFYITFIFVSAFLLRVVALDKVPFGLYSDEASIGYNAYSIAETGKDEHGFFMPAFFKAFGEYKSPVLIYFASILIKIFGPSIPVLRLAPAILGIISVIFTFFLTRLYFGEKIALIASFLFAFSPWSIVSSREVGDASSLPAFIILGFYLFSKGLKEDGKYLIFSSIPIGLSFYCYGIAKAFIPLFYLIFFILNYKTLLKKRREVIIFLSIVFILLIPLFKYSLEKKVTVRYDLLSIFNEHYSILPEKDKLMKNNFSIFGESKLTLIPIIFIKNYFRHMSFDFLLLNGDRNILQNIGGRGQILGLTFWFMVIGFIYILFKRQRNLYIFPLWFLLFPVPAALTWESLPHSARCIGGLPVFEILAALGLYQSWLFCKEFLFQSKSKLKNYIGKVFSSLVIIMIIFGIFEIASFVRNYFFHYAKRSVNAFNYDTYLISKDTQYIKDIDKFIVPYNFEPVHFLFLQKISPHAWHNNKQILRYVDAMSINNIGPNERVARIIKPGFYTNEKTIGRIYHEFTGQFLYEIKKLDKKLVKDKAHFIPRRIGGLKGEYFNTNNFEEYLFSKTDNNINFEWINTKPDPRITTSGFSIRWSGWINISESGLYEIITENDDGIFVDLNGQTIIHDGNDHPPIKNKGSIILEKGWNSILIEYFNYAGNGCAKIKIKDPHGIEKNISEYKLAEDGIY